jgi:hypothetical protein
MDRHADLVPLRRTRPPRGACLLRLRLPDRPGSLARVADRLAAHGVDILRIEVLGRDGSFAIDDLLVAGEGLGAALAELVDVAVLARRADVDLPDPALAMAAACAEITHARSPRDAKRRLLRAALGLAFADAGFVCATSGATWLEPAAATVAGLPVVDPPSLLHSALAAQHALAADSRAPWAPPAFRDRLPTGAVVVVPAAAAGVVLGLARRDDTPFVEPEVERLEALLGVAAGVLAAHDDSARPPRNRPRFSPLST